MLKRKINTSPLTRHSLLNKLKDHNDGQSWGEFNNTYAPYILRILLGLKMNLTDSQDLQQEIMLISWKSLPDFDYDPSRGSFRAWLSTITRRQTTKFITRRQRQFISPSEEKIAELKISLEDDQHNQIDQIMQLEWESFIASRAWDSVQGQFSTKVLEAFQRLGSGEEVVVIAAELDLSESSIYVYKKRVLNCLQKEIIRLDHELG